jgi:hypothetical protein
VKTEVDVSLPIERVMQNARCRRGLVRSITLIAVLIFALPIACFIDYQISTRIEPCVQLEGTSFQAMEKVALIDPGRFDHPPVYFNTRGVCWWSYSDTAMSGSYQCVAGELVVSPGDPTIEAHYDAVTGVLTWNDVVYHRQYVPSQWLNGLL